MKNKKGLFGYGVIIDWAIIIGVGVLLLIILAKTTDFGREIWDKIKNIFPFA